MPTPQWSGTRVTAVVTCMTDGERPFLGQALLSVLTQGMTTGVILCVRDDNTWVEGVLGSLKRRVQVLRMPLAPPGVVRNAAVREVGTELVAFLDGDDMWAPAKVEQQVSLLDAHALDVIASKHVLVRDDGRPFFFAFAKDVPMTSSWLGRTATFSARPFGTAGLGEDVELWQALSGEVRCGIAERFLLRYRVRQGSQSAASPSMRRKARFERRSRRPAVRPLLLVGSWAMSTGLERFGATSRSGHPAPLRFR